MTFSDPEFLKQLRAKQGEIMGRIVNRGAFALQVRLVAEVEKVAERLRSQGIAASVVQADQNSGVKSMESAKRKVYGKKLKGDWLEIRDMARCTLVVSFPWYVGPALLMLEAQFRSGSSGFMIEHNQLDDDKGGGRMGRTILGTLANAGYSGSSINISQGGNKAEIQVNTPAMMYAKDLDEFNYACPGREAEMKARFPLVPGGIGHLLYETWREETTPPDSKQIYGEASYYYYEYFRSMPVSAELGKKAAAILASLHPPIIVT